MRFKCLNHAKHLLMLEAEIKLVLGGKLNFDQPFLQFNVKKYMRRVTLKEYSQLDWKY